MNRVIIIMNGLIAGATAFRAIEHWDHGAGVAAAFTVVVGISIIVLGEHVRRIVNDADR